MPSDTKSPSEGTHPTSVPARKEPLKIEIAGTTLEWDRENRITIITNAQEGRKFKTVLDTKGHVTGQNSGPGARARVELLDVELIEKDGSARPLASLRPQFYYGGFGVMSERVGEEEAIDVTAQVERLEAVAKLLHRTGSLLYYAKWETGSISENDYKIISKSVKSAEARELIGLGYVHRCILLLRDDAQRGELVKKLVDSAFALTIGFS